VEVGCVEGGCGYAYNSFDFSVGLHIQICSIKLLSFFITLKICYMALKHSLW